ncbi:MAG: hypothetical protein LBP54_05280, partial [Campylobacteraceae bacterium]|nr:hypothetical protein [Campylobacteraceae bacterium]
FNKNPAAFKLCKLKQVKAVEGFIKTQAKNGCIFVIVSEARQSIIMNKKEFLFYTITLFLLL